MEPVSPASAGTFFTTEPPGKPKRNVSGVLTLLGWSRPLERIPQDVREAVKGRWCLCSEKKDPRGRLGPQPHQGYSRCILDSRPVHQPTITNHCWSHSSAPLFTWPTLVCLSELGSGPPPMMPSLASQVALDGIFSSPRPLCPPLPNTCPTDNSVCLPYQTVSFIRAGSLYAQHLPQCPECGWPWMFIEWVNRGQTRLEKWPGVRKESRRVLWDSEMGVGGQNEWRELEDTNFQL